MDIANFSLRLHLFEFQILAWVLILFSSITPNLSIIVFQTFRRKIMTKTQGLVFYNKVQVTDIFNLIH